MQDEIKESKVVELPSAETICYKGVRYIIRHKYQSSGDNIAAILKNQFLKILMPIENSEVS